MTTFPSLTGKALLTAPKRAGFGVLRVKGTHHCLRHAEGRVTVVPVHAGESIGRGLLTKILRDVQMDAATLQKQL